MLIGYGVQIGCADKVLPRLIAAYEDSHEFHRSLVFDIL